MEEAMTPRSALESFMRQRTPQWLSQTLKITLQPLSLEDIFSNCWILGRIADTADGLLKNNPFRCPPPDLGIRPYRDVISDIERFHAICEALRIDDDSKITLADVEQRKAGTRVALCLWDIADALRARGYSSTIPEFAPASDYAQLRKAMPRETSRMAVQKYENGALNPSFSAPRPRPTIPLLPLDTSPALQKYRERSAMSEEEKQKLKAAAKAKAAAAAAAKPSSSSSPTAKKEASTASPTAEATTSAPSGIKEPPSLSKWLPKSLSSKKKGVDGRGSGSDTGSPTVLSTLPPEETTEIASYEEEFAEASQGGIDVLAAILSPDKNKPAHTQVINALMRTAPGATPAEEATSAASAPRSKRSLGGFVENVQVVTSSRQGSGRNHHHYSNGGGGGGGDGGNTSARYVKSYNSSSTEPWWKTPLVGVIGAAVAVVVMNIVGGNKEKEYNNGGRGRRGRGGVQHAGRW